MKQLECCPTCHRPLQEEPHVLYFGGSRFDLSKKFDREVLIRVLKKMATQKDDSQLDILRHAHDVLPEAFETGTDPGDEKDDRPVS